MFFLFSYLYKWGRIVRFHPANRPREPRVLSAIVRSNPAHRPLEPRTLSPSTPRRQKIVRFNPAQGGDARN